MSNSDVVRLAIVDPVDASRNSIKNLLLGIETLWLEAESSRFEFFTEVITQTQPDIALVNLDADPEAGLNLVRELSVEAPGCSVLVVSSSQEGSLILQTMRSGAKEFLSYPLRLEDFLAALDRIRHTRSGGVGGKTNRGSQVITVAGVSGGVGCTSLAVNTTAALARNERNTVVLMDLDLALGDADIWLDIIPDYTIQDVAENISRLDFSLLKRSLTKHDCGAFLLPRPVQMEEKTAVTSDELRRVVALLKATFTHLVIDVSKSFSPLDMTAMACSDHVMLVTQLDLPCLRNVVRLLQYFDYQEGLSEKVKVVVNRLGLGDDQITVAKAAETIGREIFTSIPNDYMNMVESRNNGVPLLTQSPKAKLTRSFDDLAARFDEDLAGVSRAGGESKAKKSSLFGIFGGRK